MHTWKVISLGFFQSEQAKAEENRQGGANTNVEDMEEGSSSEDEEEEEGEDGAVPQPIGESNFNYLEISTLEM